MMPADGVPVLAVWPPGARARGARLFDALEAAFAVRLVPWRRGGGPYAALIADGGGAVAATGLARVPRIEFGAPAGRAPAAPTARAAARLAALPPVDRRLHGVRVPCQPAAAPLTPAPGELILARTDAGPAWTRRPGPVSADRVRDPLPPLAAAEPLRDQLRDGRTLALLALVHLLRSLGPPRLRPPPLRAAFVFDDPNLLRPSYGFIDYPRLLAHADRHGYHAAMAMIPLDARRAHPDAAAAFGRRADRLSLVIHGNNHTRDELLQPRATADALRPAAQALRRIARFEASTGLRVDRVMMPPHGMCSRATTGALGSLGYDALCAQHPCPWTEHPPADRVLAGWLPAEFVDGCAVLPRLPLGCSATELALRAFLDQPLVLYGHHGDLAGGLAPLAEAAARVNRLGAVRWCSVGELVRTNRHLRDSGHAAEVVPWGGRILVPAGPGPRELTVRAPAAGDARLAGWSLVDAAAQTLPFDVPCPVDGGRATDLRLVPEQRADARTVPAPPTHPWVRLRRAATQARDRSAPLRARRRVTP